MPYIGKAPKNSVRNRYVYQATAGQTTFTGSDTNALTLSYSDSLYVDVYQNGVLLNPATDYAATTGTSVVLTSSASTNDVVEMIVYDVFDVADGYTKAQADARYPFLGNNSIMRTNGNTITGNITIDASTNAMSAGPITVNSNITVTVNGYWIIL